MSPDPVCMYVLRMTYVYMQYAVSTRFVVLVWYRTDLNDISKIYRSVYEGADRLGAMLLDNSSFKFASQAFESNPFKGRWGRLEKNFFIFTADHTGTCTQRLYRVDRIITRARECASHQSLIFLAD